MKPVMKIMKLVMTFTYSRRSGLNMTKHTKYISTNMNFILNKFKNDYEKLAKEFPEFK